MVDISSESPGLSSRPAGTGTVVEDAPIHSLVRLFVFQGSANSLLAEANLRSFIAAHPELLLDFELVDVGAQPAVALAAGVFVTPTLVRVAEQSSVIAVGNLRDQAALLELLS